MSWVKAFYSQQYDLYDGYRQTEIQDYHRSLAARIEKYAGPGHKRVLELGAGGGQAAAAMAEIGHAVTAIELVPEAAANIQRFADISPNLDLTVINGDFYEVQFDHPFDVVCYWDGFGVGSDADQHRLLQRIASWLTPDGCALLDVSTPWYWAQAAGQENHSPTFGRRYDFDPDNCTLTDTWWPTNAPDNKLTQYLRCYSPADLRLLAQDTGLELEVVETGGAVNYTTQTYEPHVPLIRAMSFLAKFVLI